MSQNHSAAPAEPPRPTEPAQRAGSRSGSAAASIALVAIFTAFIIACSLAPAIPLGALAVPLTLQTFGVVLTALLLGGTRAFLAVLLYLVLGLLGLPIFAGYHGGITSLAAPSVGYLLSFAVLALVLGALAHRLVRAAAARSGTSRRRLSRGGLFAALLLASIVCSLVICHGMGILGMMLVLHLKFPAALLADLAFVPGDILKCVVAVAIAMLAYRAYSRFLVYRS